MVVGCDHLVYGWLGLVGLLLVVVFGGFGTCVLLVCVWLVIIRLCLLFVVGCCLLAGFVG